MEDHGDLQGITIRNVCVKTYSELTDVERQRCFQTIFPSLYEEKMLSDNYTFPDDRENPDDHDMWQHFNEVIVFTKKESYLDFVFIEFSYDSEDMLFSCWVNLEGEYDNYELCGYIYKGDENIISIRENMSYYAYIYENEDRELSINELNMNTFFGMFHDITYDIGKFCEKYCEGDLVKAARVTSQ